MKNKVSIIVPMYNVEQYISESIESLIYQTYDNIEILLIDDGSIDNTLKIAEDYANQDSRIRIISTENNGVSAARNTGLASATGDYIGFLDSDDWFEKNAIETMVSNLEKENADLSIVSYAKVFGDEKRFEKKENVYKVFSTKDAYKLVNSDDLYFGVALWDRIAKRELYKEIEFEVGRTAEDFEVVFELFDRARTIVYDSKPLVNYRQRLGSITHSNKIETNPYIKTKEMMKQVEQRYPDILPFARFGHALASMGVYNQILRNSKDASVEDSKKYSTIQKDILKFLRKYSISMTKEVEMKKNRKIQMLLLAFATPIYKPIFLSARKWLHRGTE